MTHTFLDSTIDFNIIYKRRKTIGIYIDTYGNIELRVPNQTSMNVILTVLEKQWEWVLRKSKEMKDRTAGHKDKVYDQGEVFLYLGNSYPISIIEDVNINRDYVLFEDDGLKIYLKEHTNEAVKQALKRFYYQQCKALVRKQIAIHQSEFKTKPLSIRISSNKSSWGTCNSKYELTFNWKLAMAPIEVIDYVVVHEMCHMVHLNHERSYWRLVGKILPEYEQSKKWLELSSWKMIV